MYVNFQKNRVNRSVITVHTNLFAKYLKLSKFATTNSNSFKLTQSDMHHRETYMYINFQQNWVSIDQSNPYTQIYLHKIANCIYLKLAIRITKNHAFQTCTTSLPNGHSGRL